MPCYICENVHAMGMNEISREKKSKFLYVFYTFIHQIQTFNVLKGVLDARLTCFNCNQTKAKVWTSIRLRTKFMHCLLCVDNGINDYTTLHNRLHNIQFLSSWFHFCFDFSLVQFQVIIKPELRGISWIL